VANTNRVVTPHIGSQRSAKPRRGRNG
jgi:hypothetical protein